MHFNQDQILVIIHKQRDLLILGGFGIIMLVLGIKEWNRIDRSEEIIIAEEDPIDVVVGDVLIDISGAVERPGVYRLAIDSRMGQAIEAAGGFNESANSDWISRELNLAAPIQDGSKIYIPFNGDTSDTVELRTVVSDAPIININTASLSELMEIKGVGEVRGETIISSRPYTSLDELKEKTNLPQTIIDELSKSIVFY